MGPAHCGHIRATLVEQDQCSARHTVWGTGSNAQMSLRVPVPTCPVPRGPALCHSCGEGPKYPWLSQLALLRGGSCVRAAQESLFSRLCPRGAGLQLGKGTPCPTDPASRSKRLLGQLGCRFAMPVTGPQSCACQVEEAEDVQTCKPGANTTAGAGPASSWTEVPIPSMSPKPAVPGHVLGWCGSRGTWGARAWVQHAPNIHSSITSTTVGAKDSGCPTWDTADGWTVKHHISLVDRLIPELQSWVSLSHCSSTSASGLHCQLWPGSRHLHWIPPALQVLSPSLLTTGIQGVSATTGMCFCHKCPLHGSSSATQRSWDASHFACGPPRAWLCCVSVLAVC